MSGRVMITQVITFKENSMKEKDHQSNDCNHSAVLASKSTSVCEKKCKETKEYKDTSKQGE